jgi:hypothetical protein
MEGKKRLQSEYLQLAIDNEKIKEQRVSDYKNPNKPPPIPPQYKTNAEIQGDAMEQQKMVIDNLRSLGLDFQLATQISQDLKTDIPGGDGNFLKFNKNFPYFKEKIEKGFNAKGATRTEMLEKINEYFDDIDNAMGLTLGGVSSTNFFGTKPLTTISFFPSSEAYKQLEADVDALVGTYSLPLTSITGLKTLLTTLIAESPTDDDLKSIETFPNIIKTKINKSLELLITKFNFPTSQFLFDVNVALGTVSSPPEATALLAQISRAVGMVNTRSFDKLKEVMTKIKEEQANLFATATGISSGISTISMTPTLITSAIANQIKENKKYVNDQISSGLAQRELNERLYNPATKAMYSDFYINNYPTIDGNPPNGKTDDGDNAIYEYGTAYGGIGKLKRSIRIRYAGGTPIKVSGPNEEYDIRFWDGYTWVPTGAKGELVKYTGDVGLNGASDASATIKTYYRYTNDELKDIIKRNELPQILARIDADPAYQPKYVEASRILAQRAGSSAHPYIGGFGLKKRIKVGRGDPNDPWRNTGYTKYYHPNMTPEEYKHEKWGTPLPTTGQGMKKKKGKDDSSSDEDNIHIDINSHNGKNYHMNGEGFIKRRIKIGKGIELKKDEPKFRAFGKYIIHMPQLHNNNILNFKHKSGGTIPSIKPVEINDNFKDFILDVIDSGRVNDKHYDSLTEPEKNHFIKVVRGAGIIQDLKLKQSNHDAEKEDLNRLDLLLGEIDAGNDNEKMIKEAKVLIKRYVANGRISRQKGFDMLSELE